MILIVDTCLGYLTVAIAKSHIIKQVKIIDLNQQSKLLASTVSALLESAGKHVMDIDTILITKGPGSFTGIRIGLSFVLGVQEITHAEVCACSTLAALNEDYAGKTIATIHAGTGSYYTQRFMNHISESDITIMTRSELNKITDTKVIGHYRDPALTPDPAVMLKLFKNPHSTEFSGEVAPLYIKAPYF